MNQAVSLLSTCYHTMALTKQFQFCSEELARKLATARAERKQLNELLATDHTAGDPSDSSQEEGAVTSDDKETKPQLVIIVKADTQVHFDPRLILATVLSHLTPSRTICLVFGKQLFCPSRRASWRPDTATLTQASSALVAPSATGCLLCRALPRLSVLPWRAWPAVWWM